MQSPTAIALRALVMLLFLIAVPVIAIFNGQIREAAKAWLDGRSAVAAPAKPGANPASPAPLAGEVASQAPPYKSSAAALPGSVGPATPPAAAAKEKPKSDGGWMSPPQPVGSPAAKAELVDNKVRPANFEQPLARPGDVPNWPSPNDRGNSPHVLAVNPRVDEANAQLNVPNHSAGDQLAGRSPMPVEPRFDREPQSSAGESMQSMQQRLQELGATYYRLETWGAGGEQYRFYCMVAVGQDASFVRCFQAVDVDAMKAMQQVLAQTEAWRANRPAF